MLNYIWLALIVLGIGVAVWTDVQDLSTNRYHNGAVVSADVIPAGTAPADSASRTGSFPCTVIITPSDFNAAYGASVSDTIRQRGDCTGSTIRISVDEATPAVWKDILRAQNGADYLLVHFRPAGDGRRAFLSLDPVKFAKLNSVTNDGIIKYAKTAVELAIGLIGIMALWLGIMKIADQSGLVSILARLLRPATTRIFPDVPADHPAMGAMIMNISANMLGLSNAATPLGIKAMEELNKLNTKAGTATDAMCTFLVINTSNVQLIPATTIAIRAAAGSANPAEILGPVIAVTVLTWIIGITTVKLLAKLPVFRQSRPPMASA